MNRLDLAKVGSMTFQKPDLENFPCLKMAYETGRVGGIMPCVMNAANEIAVSAFLNKKIRFVEIAEIVADSIQSFKAEPADSIEKLIQTDAHAREIATELIGRKDS